MQCQDTVLSHAIRISPFDHNIATLMYFICPTPPWKFQELEAASKRIFLLPLLSTVCIGAYLQSDELLEAAYWVDLHALNMAFWDIMALAAVTAGPLWPLWALATIVVVAAFFMTGQKLSDPQIRSASYALSALVAVLLIFFAKSALFRYVGYALSM